MTDWRKPIENTIATIEEAIETLAERTTPEALGTRDLLEQALLMARMELATGHFINEGT